MLEQYAGIFAAGEGSRLKAAYPGVIKPMVPIAGAPIIEWSVRLLLEAGFTEIAVLLNSSGRPAREHLKRRFPKTKFVFIIKDTASSYESFRLVAQTLAQKSENFMLTAVDSFYDPARLKEFSDIALKSGAPAVLGITNKIEDEKPLWADVAESGLIKALGPDASQKIYATSGIYYISRKLAEEMPAPARFKALREYLGELVKMGTPVYSALVPQSVDIDDAADIPLAEEFISKHLTLKR